MPYVCESVGPNAPIYFLDPTRLHLPATSTFCKRGRSHFTHSTCFGNPFFLAQRAEGCEGVLHTNRTCIDLKLSAR